MFCLSEKASELIAEAVRVYRAVSLNYEKNQSKTSRA